MADVLIRGLTREAVDSIDAAASELGLSRNEYLRRMLERGASVREGQVVTAADWSRSAEAFADLDAPSVMDAAWR